MSYLSKAHYDRLNPLTSNHTRMPLPDSYAHIELESLIVTKHLLTLYLNKALYDRLNPLTSNHTRMPYQISYGYIES